MGSKDKNATVDQGLKQLRHELVVDGGGEAAPTVAARRELKLDDNHADGLKKLAVRALILAMLIVVITQIVFQTVVLPRQLRGGPIPMEAAIEQIDEDLAPTPAPPPSLRP